jgi:hypothetical protein
MAVVQVVVSCVFHVDVVSFNCVEMCSFLLVIEDLHRVVYGVEGLCMFYEVLSKFRGVAIVSEG